jgi:hypothetical protein
LLNSCHARSDLQLVRPTILPAKTTLRAAQRMGSERDDGGRILAVIAALHGVDPGMQLGAALWLDQLAVR